MDESPDERTERWYRQHVDAAYRLAHRVTGDGDDAADVVHAAFADILANGHVPRDAGSERSWLMGVIWNHSMLFKRGAGRRRRRERVIMEQPRELAEDPGQAVLRAEQRQLVTQCLESLGERDRAVLHMHFCEGMSQREIAAAMGSKQGTVGSWISRASKRFEVVLRRAGLGVGLALLLALRETAAGEVPSGLHRRLDALRRAPPAQATAAPRPAISAGMKAVPLSLAGGAMAAALVLVIWWWQAPVQVAEGGAQPPIATETEQQPMATVSAPAALVPDEPPAVTPADPVIAAGFGPPWHSVGAWQPQRRAADAVLVFPGDPAAEADLQVGMRMQGQERPMRMPAWNCQMRYQRRVPVDSTGIDLRMVLAPESHLVQGWEFIVELHGQDAAGAAAMQRLRVSKNSGQSIVRLWAEQDGDWQVVGEPLDHPQAVQLGIACHPDRLAVMLDTSELGAWRPGFTVTGIECGIQLWKLTFCRVTSLRMRDFSIVRGDRSPVF